MRVLLIANLTERHAGRRYYFTGPKLANGFTRTGAAVLTFNDRDVSERLAPFAFRPWGRGKMNRLLLETVENFKPDLIVMHHADLVERRTLAAIRARATAPRIVLVNVDPLFDPKPPVNIRRYHDLVDAVFMTTAGEALKTVAHPNTRVRFMPNPVDRAFETGRAFDVTDPDADVFFAGRPEQDPGDRPKTDRLSVPLALRERLPQVRFAFHGFDGKPALVGHAYAAVVGRCRMGLNLNRVSGYHLYSSGRIAQYMGHGLLCFQERGNGFETLFTEDELGFYSDLDDLAAQISAFKADDARARAIAAAGHKKAHDWFAIDRIVPYLIQGAFGAPIHPDDYPWPTEAY